MIIIAEISILIVLVARYSSACLWSRLAQMRFTIVMLGGVVVPVAAIIVPMFLLWRLPALWRQLALPAIYGVRHRLEQFRSDVPAGLARLTHICDAFSSLKVCVYVVLVVSSTLAWRRITLAWR